MTARLSSTLRAACSSTTASWSSGLRRPALGRSVASTTYDLRPDVILVDVDLGEENGFALAEQIRSGLPTPPPVIMISTHDEQDLAGLIAARPAVGSVAKLGLSGGAVRDLLAGSAGLGEGDHR
jgi:CheY-like chemotaxis protein